jgi:hypothetical protein
MDLFSFFAVVECVVKEKSGHWLIERVRANLDFPIRKLKASTISLFGYSRTSSAKEALEIRTGLQSCYRYHFLPMKLSTLAQYIHGFSLRL